MYLNDKCLKAKREIERIENALKSDSVLNKLHSNQEKLKSAGIKGEERVAKKEELQK